MGKPEETSNDRDEGAKQTLSTLTASDGFGPKWAGGKNDGPYLMSEPSGSQCPSMAVFQQRHIGPVALGDTSLPASALLAYLAQVGRDRGGKHGQL